MTNKFNIFSLLSQQKELKKEEIEKIFKLYETSETLNEIEMINLVKDFYAECISDKTEIQNDSFFNSEKGQLLISNSIKKLTTLREKNEKKILVWQDLSSELDYWKTKQSGMFWKLAPLVDFKVEMTTNQKQDKLYQLKVFIAGGIAGACSKSVGAPLSRITTLQQTQEFRNTGKTITMKLTNVQWAKKIFTEEGLKGFFRGNMADVARSIPYSGICYLAYEKLKSIFLPFDKSKNGRNARLMAGGLSGPMSLILVYPIDVIRTRLAAQTSTNLKYKGIISTFKTIRKEEGMKAFYRGSVISLFQSFPNLAINFTVFEELVQKLEEKGHKGVFYSIACGAVSGICAQSMTYPMDVIVRNMQLDGKGKKFKSAGDLMKKVFVSQGITGFYSGYTAMLLKSIPVCAISFGVYDQMRRIFNIKPK
jgi:solute carrier family 25 (mitochondrial phosphate transporter), member 23/24/25/41